MYVKLSFKGVGPIPYEKRSVFERQFNFLRFVRVGTLEAPDIHTCSQVSNMHARLTISNIHACLGASNIHTCIHTHYSPVALIKTSLTAHVQSQILATHSITLMNIHCGLSACALSKFPIKSPLLSSYS